MSLKRPKKKLLIMLLVKRAVLFLFALNFLSLFLYVVGTAQEFLDSTQLMLLRISSALGLLVAIAALYGFAFNVFFLVRRRKLSFLAGTLSYLLLAIAGAVIASLISFILVALSGNIS